MRSPAGWMDRPSTSTKWSSSRALLIRRGHASGSGNRGARIHTSCAIGVAPTLDRAFARWCFTVTASARTVQREKVRCVMPLEATSDVTL